MDGDMLLAVDIGNTHITLGVFNGEKLGPRWRMATLINRTSDEFGLQMLGLFHHCLLYTSPSPRDGLLSRMPSSA